MYIYINIHDIFIHPNSDDAKIQNFWKSYNVDGSEILEILHQLKTVVNIPLLIQCEAPKIAKLVYNSNNYGLWYF